MGVLVVLLAILVARSWDPDQALGYNVATLVAPLIAPSPNWSWEAIAMLPHDEQIKVLNTMIGQQDDAFASEQTVRMIFSSAVAEASFGPNATRVAELEIPSRQSGRTIPVTCACPHTAAATDTLPLVIYFHGGGMIMGSAKAELGMSRSIADVVGVVVCSIEYRMAPGHPFPAAIHDAVDASLAMLGKADTESPVPKAMRLKAIRADGWGLFGGSAGGYMAANTARQLAHLGHTAAIQVSLTPMAKPHGGTLSAMRNWKRWGWSGTANAYAWSSYLPGDDGSLAKSWEVSLLVDPPAETVARLPKAHIQVNTQDVLRDEGAMYADRLRAIGKLVGFVECNTGHIGGLPGSLSDGGPGEGSFNKGIAALAQAIWPEVGMLHH